MTIIYLHFLLLVAAVLAIPVQAGQTPGIPEAAKLQRSGDTDAAVAIWTPLAKAGEVDAAYNLDVIHQHGDGVAKSPAEALNWYRFAAERGDRGAQSQLGAMYLNGEGTPKDEKEGWRWINQHRVDHAHHAHHPQMQAWRKQAAALIWASDMRETIAASHGTSEQLMADLRRRAGTTAA